MKSILSPRRAGVNCNQKKWIESGGLQRPPQRPPHGDSPSGSVVKCGIRVNDVGLVVAIFRRSNNGKIRRSKPWTD